MGSVHGALAYHARLRLISVGRRKRGATRFPADLGARGGPHGSHLLRAHADDVSGSAEWSIGLLSDGHGHRCVVDVRWGIETRRHRRSETDCRQEI